MRALSALATFMLFAASLAACGGSGSSVDASAQHSSTAASASPPSTNSTESSTAAAHSPGGGRASATPSETSGPLQANTTPRNREEHDRDEDDFTPVPDDQNPSPVGFAPAGPADRLAITELIKRYYAAALKMDGAKGCSMFGAAMARAVPVTYGEHGARFLRRAAGTCSAVISLLFRHEHRLLVREVPELKVARVSVLGNQGVAFLLFGRLYERDITEMREGGTWKIAAPLDGELE
jgi:hypothetical protein